MKLNKLGLNDFFLTQVEEEEKIGRVSGYAQNVFKLFTEEGKVNASINGKMLFENIRPAIGDFVVYKTSDDGTHHRIDRILSRQTALSRKAAGDRFDEQIIAANMDYLFIVMSLNEDFNLRRLERYMVGAWESGATPVIILTKVDLCDDLEDKMELVNSVTFGVTTIAISALEKINIQALDDYNKEGTTIALVGSSGVGKSTLINTLAGKEVMKTDGLRNDDKGHHTTTHREMILTDTAILIDTPGMREFSVTGDESSLNSEFSDIVELSMQCKFKDCQHKKEPGCAIQKALADGDLDHKRLNSYYSLKREMRFQNRKMKQQEHMAKKMLEKKQRKSKPRKKDWNSTNY
jgi:ribosome biogenesis GTPase